MKRLVLIVVAVGALAWPALAAAHPLGNFTINRFSRIEVSGPRLLRTYAVWAGEENRIFFYASSGERFAEVRLSESPDPLELAA